MFDLFGNKIKKTRRSMSAAGISPDATAVDMEYEMWCLPLHHFVGLSKMRPHQELLKEGKLARYDHSMKAVFFISHRKLRESCGST